MIHPALAIVLSTLFLAPAPNPASTPAGKAPPIPHFEYQTAKIHELKPHRGSIPTEGAEGGLNQLHIYLTISPTGDVLSAEAGPDFKDPASRNGESFADFWPKVRDEVLNWKFTPFESNGHPITAQIEEYVDLVPPEQLPTKHIEPPSLRPNSAIAITLRRTGCLGTCPGYSVTLANSGITFDGGSFTVARGKHTAPIDPEALRALARKFLKADFYSRKENYEAGVTDCPTYILSIAINGNSKQVSDYMGTWVGMPAIITELEEEVDDLAQTSRWIKGTDGLVPALQAEHYNFKSYDAQVILKAAAQRGESSTVEDLLEAGVPINPLPAPKPSSPYQGVPFEHVGWLTAASGDPKTLQLLIDNQLSHDDQADKDLALINAARSGNLESVRALIDYGANPNTDLSKLTITDNFLNMSMTHSGPGSILIYAAASGQPDVVREILQYHPSVNARDGGGRTALFAASESRYEKQEGVRAECIRLLVQAGADVNARDSSGNTPLHETYATEVEEELLKLGADVNARNNNGETPAFTTVDDSAMLLFAKHGADFTLRNNKGQTALEAASSQGPLRIEALKKAIATQNQSPASPDPAQPHPAGPQ